MRGRRSWWLCWPSTYVSVNIVITSWREVAGRCAGRLPVCLSNTVITSRGEEGAGRCAGRLPVCLSTLWSPPEGKKELVAVLAVYLCVWLTLWSLHEGKKELVAVLAVYLSVCQHCDHLTRGRRSWSLCWPVCHLLANRLLARIFFDSNTGRCAGSNIVNLWSPHEGKKELVAVLAVYLCICLTWRSLHEGKKEVVAVLAVYLCICLTLWPHHEGKRELVAVLAVYLCINVSWFHVL